MAIINNAPTIVGGGTPTPSGGNYKLKKVSLQLILSTNGSNIVAVVPQNEYMSNFWQWLYENSCPGQWELLIGITGGSQYGLTPSYPYKGIFAAGTTLDINFATNWKHDPSDNTYECVMLSNATVDANSNIITIPLAELMYVKDTVNKNQALTRKNTAFANTTTNMYMEIQFIAIESEE